MTNSGKATDDFLSKSERAKLLAINAKTKQGVRDSRASNTTELANTGNQKLITFLRDQGGHRAGASQYFPRIRAEMMMDSGVAMDAAAFEALPDDKKARILRVDHTAASPKI